MGWTLSGSVADFQAAAGQLLAANPAENTVLLTVSQRLAEAGPTAFGGEPARFGWWREGDESPIAGAFLETPPYPLRLSAMPGAAAGDLGRTLAGSQCDVAGAPATVEAFVDAWTTSASGTATVRMNQRLYGLGTLVTPNVPGTVRGAEDADRSVLIDWFVAFGTEIAVPVGDAARAIDARLVSGGLHLWEVDGDPVSMAGSSPVIAGMARIGPVYTPPAQRRRGYASAVTAAASADALARRAEQVVLYTDLSNPTSNSIYQAIGYRPIADDVTVELRSSLL
jgi:FR47-like protein